MPYIAPHLRPRLDEHIDKLAAQITAIVKEDGHPTTFAGLLNYCCTTLLLKALPERRYWVIAMVTGVVHNVLDEFYRRYGVPYEDEQIVKNGDVYPRSSGFTPRSP